MAGSLESAEDPRQGLALQIASVDRHTSLPKHKLILLLKPNRVQTHRVLLIFFGGEGSLRFKNKTDSLENVNGINNLFS